VKAKGSAQNNLEFGPIHNFLGIRFFGTIFAIRMLYI
jgi:hypothetical protein